MVLLNHLAAMAAVTVLGLDLVGIRCPKLGKEHA
jgi:uncharacterized protein (UPF0210 family)